MADFTVYIPDSFVARLQPAVVERAINIEGNAVVMGKLLPHYGVSSVLDLTDKEKAELCCQLHLWQLENQFHRDNEVEAAREAADQDSYDSFNP